MSGEVGKTIAAATAGATIHKAEIFLYCNFAYYGNGGQAVISTHGLTSMTNTVPNTTKLATTGEGSGWWPRSAGRWVDITSLWDAGKRGIWVGRVGSNLRQYMAFDGHTAPDARKPRIRLTYSR